MKRLTRGFFAGVAAVAALSACEKFEVSPQGSPAGMVCLNADPRNGLGDPLDPKREFNRPVFEEEFNGKVGSGEPADCFDDDSLAICKYRLDIGLSGPCKHSVAHLKNLNKCRWTIWDGFSFWEGSDRLAFTPSQIDVRDGMYKIKIRLRADSEGPFQCGKTTKPDDAVDHFDTNCPIFTGGIDTEFRPGTRMKGRNIKEGRIEARAKLTHTPGLWPAIWMWPASWNGRDGYPYTYNPVPGRNYIPETDIMEMWTFGNSGKIPAVQTYHDWIAGSDAHASIGVDTLVDPAIWHVFGVERHAREIRYYVDHCYTKIIKDGDEDKRYGSGRVRVDPYASFLMLSMDLQKDAALKHLSTMQDAEFNIDWMRMYER